MYLGQPLTSIVSHVCDDKAWMKADHLEVILLQVVCKHSCFCIQSKGGETEVSVQHGMQDGQITVDRAALHPSGASACTATNSFALD